MTRYGVYRVGASDLILDVQSTYLAELNTRLVVPLMPPEQAPIPGRRLNPSFVIDGRRLTMVTQYLSAVPVNTLGKSVTELSAHRDEIVAALDMVLHGF
jgi:toxin CcdB